MIVNRMNQPAPVMINLDGEYSPNSNTGTIYATFRNDSSATITGRVIFVITEDSLFYPAPNGVIWHCNVPRDYIPDDSGVVVTINPGDSVTVTMPFITHPTWNKTHCKIKTWIQNDQMQPDTTKEIWQGAMVNLLELGIEDNFSPTHKEVLKVSPNPCLRNGTVQFNLPYAAFYEISIYDCSGKRVKKIINNAKHAIWNLNEGYGVNPGVYFYRVVSKKFVKTGKIVIE
ncbi:MAG: T9SS type A sorting domain-containing protein [candidate division WOR-3 bacterium]